MRKTLTVLVLALTTVLATACGSGRSSRPGPEATTVLEVDNQSFNDMTIFIVNGGQRVRLGRATGKTKTALTIPRGILTFPRELQFEADPFGARGGTITNRVWVTPGDRVGMIITG
jgi:hypothetical protein